MTSAATRSDHVVVVVGAGPSGLAAAHRLTRAGRRVLVLEAGDRVGGKMSTVRREGFVIDDGAFFLTSTYRNLLQIIDEIGMSGDLVESRFVLSVLRDGVRHDLDGEHLVSSVARTGLLSVRAKAELVKLVPELLRSRNAVYDRIITAGRYDGQSVAAWSAANLSPELREYLIGAMVRGISATDGESSSRVDFLALLSLLRGAKLLALRDGMASYPERLAQNVEVELGAEVLAVETAAGGVSITSVDTQGIRSVRQAAGCVVAVEGEVAARIMPGLDSWRRCYLQQIINKPLLVVNIGLADRPAMDTTYVMVPASAESFITGVMLDHQKAPGRAPAGKGLLSVALLDSWSRHHWDTQDAEICASVQADLARILPGIVGTVEFASVSRWHLEANPVGAYRHLRQFRDLCARDTRIQLAGDSHSMQNIEAATVTGLRAADRLLAAGIAAV